MPWRLLIFIARQVHVLSLCYIFNSPSSLVSRNYDYLWCLLAYLFYCQKGIVLHFCVQPYYSQLHVHVIIILDVCYL